MMTDNKKTLDLWKKIEYSGVSFKKLMLFSVSMEIPRSAMFRSPGR